ncbi:hypothetical protein E2562_007009 [Oryza meyeriana var. granulata]|uniref:Uncharacterized protein n=1 Tax=Oryza meyeriana var. granulata TaxID=110450 RepID=A0A6G1E9N8_9ORYZ|nr:hypothetical protein E2562_007009 [Oryza meyeriana var. granulata]
MPAVGGGHTPTPQAVKVIHLVPGADEPGTDYDSGEGNQAGSGMGNQRPLYGYDGTGSIGAPVEQEEFTMVRGGGATSLFIR